MSGFGRFLKGRATLLASVAFTSTGMLGMAVPAMGQDATWLANPGSADYNTGANWTPVAVPTGTAFFGNSNTTALTLSASTTVGGWTFNPGASNYNLDNNNSLTFSGAGVSIQGGSATITNSVLRTISFANSSTAGSATIINANSGTVVFNDSSSAGSAAITSNGIGSRVSFTGTSSAAGATLGGGAGSAFSFIGGSTAGGATITSSGAVLFANSSTAGSAKITNSGSSFISFADTSTAGSATITNSAFQGSTVFNGSSSAASAAITNSGFQSSAVFNNTSSAGSAVIKNSGNGNAVSFHDSSTAGSAKITNGVSSTISFANSSTAGSATITNANQGTVAFNDSSSAGSAAITSSGPGSRVTFTGTSSAASATLSGGAGSSVSFNDSSTAGSATIASSGAVVFNDSSTAGNATITFGFLGRFSEISSGGSARLIVNAGATLDFSQLTSAGTAAGSIEGAGTFTLGSRSLSVGGNGLSTMVSGSIEGVGGSLVKTGTGTMILSGANTYTGPTTVNGGVLEVNGSIASSSLTNVDAGGTLGGIGTVGNTFVNDGTLSPGNSIGTLNISGSLTLTAASTYLVQVSATTSDLTIVASTANLAGTVVVDPMTRLIRKTTYTIMSSAGLNSTFNSANVLMGNNFAHNPILSYVGNDVLLTLDPGLLAPILPGNTSTNQRNVAGAIDNGLLAGSNLSNAFGAIFALSGDGLLNGLTQLSGETATGSQQTTFDAMNLFMGVMTDPFTAGRGGNAPGTSGFADEDNANAYAANGRKRPSAEREAYAMFTKAPPRAFEGRWNVWAAGFGGSQTTDGNAALGSNTATSRVGGVAVGADYWLSPQTIAGFALAGGGTNFSVNGGGSGRSDLFQAGAFVRHTIGSAYLTAAAAYGWQDITTDRTVTVAGVDRLRAQFNANAFSGRVEGGNRYLLPWIGGIGLTSYAAAQVTAFDLPAYAESVVSGANTFALAYVAKTVTATRSELGLRSDKSWVIGDAILTLRGRAAWAHDYNTDRSIAATFQTLPGASFVVNGAAQSPDKALTTASAEVNWRNGFSIATTFEGEFSGNSSSYAGKGAARYQW